jgi:hypothetical protein
MLDYLTHQVRSLQPGQRIRIEDQLLNKLRPPVGGMFVFLDVPDPPFRILERIVGSAWEWRWWKDPMDEKCTTFDRLREPLDPREGLRASVDWDRRYLFEKTWDGFYKRKSEPAEVA